MSAYDWDYATPGANRAAIIAAAGDELNSSFDETEWMLTAIKDLPQEEDTATAGKVLVPSYALHICFGKAYHRQGPTAWYASDTIVDSESFAYTKAALEAAEFHLDDDGEPRSWVNMFHFRYDVGVFADKCRGGDDDSPWYIYDEDGVAVPNPAAAGAYTVLDELWVDTMKCNGNCSPWMLLVLSLIHI